MEELKYYHAIESQRFLFRKLRKEDCEVWERFFIDNPSLHFLGIDLNIDDALKAINWLDIQFKRYEKNLYGHLAIIHKESNEFIGQAGILPREIDGKKEFEIGYSIMKEHWNKGYASEISQRLRDYAFEEDIHPRLISIIHTENIASQKVADKNGMKPSPLTQHEGMDVFIYSVSKDDWLSLS